MKKAAYFFKPKTKYPERIYIFYSYDEWRQRNFRPMGLYNEYYFPLLVRKMTEIEIEDENEKGKYRLMYYQYENWNELIRGELQVGLPVDFVENKILPLTQKYKLDGQRVKDVSVIKQYLDKINAFKPGIQLSLF